MKNDKFYFLREVCGKLKKIDFHASYKDFSNIKCIDARMEFLRFCSIDVLLANIINIEMTDLFLCHCLKRWAGKSDLYFMYIFRP